MNPRRDVKKGMFCLLVLATSYVFCSCSSEILTSNLLNDEQKEGYVTVGISDVVDSSNILTSIVTDNVTEDESVDAEVSGDLLGTSEMLTSEVMDVGKNEDYIITEIVNEVSMNSTPVAITFPAHQYAENSYNDELLDIEPFTLSVSLPEGWYTALPERSEYDDIDGLLVESSAVYIYDENGKQTGKVDYNTFDLEALAAQGVDITEKLPYRAVYSDIMLANHLTWDCDYTEVRTDGAVTSATCKVMMSALISGTGETEYFPAALAYNSELQVYVQFRFDEGGITDAELAALAYSVDISR